MKLIFETASGQVCFVKVPNYCDYDQVPDLLSRAKTVVDDTIMESTVILHGDDWLTNDELKQLDTDGKIVRPMREILLP